MRLLVNARECRVDQTPDCWQTLLDRVEDEAARAGHLVTAIRFDGVEEPAFRDGALLARPLGEVSVVEVETALPTSLLDDVLENGIAAADLLSATASEVAAAFRGDDIEQANQRLVELSDGVRTIVSLAQVCTNAMGIEFATFAVSGSAIATAASALEARLSSLIDAQRQQDWVTVADSLEYDVEPALQSWRDVFVELKDLNDRAAALAEHAASA